MNNTMRIIILTTLFIVNIFALSLDEYKSLGIMSYKKGDYNSSIRYFFNVLDIQENMQPLNSVEIATTYNNIASLYREVNNYTQALKYHKKFQG